MTLATLRLGRLKGVSRPALVTLMPTKSDNRSVLLDVGANVDCDANNLREFAIMGQVYAEDVLGIDNPLTGLLSNGEEESKGNELTKEAFALLKNLKGFIGNVEGKDIFNGKANVIVCDGFTGNILLKTSEGVVSTVFELMKQYIRKSLPAKIGAFMMRKKVFVNMKKQVDKDEYGGAPLLGIDGCAIISHGASNAKAIKNAIFQAVKYTQSGVNKEIEELLS